MTPVGHQGWLELSLTRGDPNNFINKFEPGFNLAQPVDVLPFDLAADMAAQLIASKYNNLHLSLSGGLDSEYVAKVLLRNSIEFTPVIVLAPWNQLESWFAFKICDDHKLTPKILDYRSIDDYHALVKRMLTYCIKLQSPIWITILPLIIAEEIGDGRLITGSGEVFYDSKSYQEPTGSLLNFVCYNHWLEIGHGDLHPGAFFSYTPELFRAGIANIDITKNSQVAKSELYQISFRPKMHNHPFEYYQTDAVTTMINTLKNKMPAIEHCRIQRDDLLNRLT
jgi:hypothetical protein